MNEDKTTTAAPVLGDRRARLTRNYHYAPTIEGTNAVFADGTVMRMTRQGWRHDMRITLPNGETQTITRREYKLLRKARKATRRLRYRMAKREAATV